MLKVALGSGFKSQLIYLSDDLWPFCETVGMHIIYHCKHAECNMLYLLADFPYFKYENIFRSRKADKYAEGIYLSSLQKCSRI